MSKNIGEGYSIVRGGPPAVPGVARARAKTYGPGLPGAARGECLPDDRQVYQVQGPT